MMDEGSFRELGVIVVIDSARFSRYYIGERWPTVYVNDADCYVFF